jgi:hypothetical protein
MFRAAPSYPYVEPGVAGAISPNSVLACQELNVCIEGRIWPIRFVRVARDPSRLQERNRRSDQRSWRNIFASGHSTLMLPRLIAATNAW